MNAEYESPAYATEQMTSDYGEPWLILNPGRIGTAQWLYYAADILTAKDFDDDDLWYLCLEHVIDEFVDLDPDINVYQGQVAANITASQDNVEVLLGKIGYYVEYNEPRWYVRAIAWLKQEYATGNAFGKKGGSKIPDNVINKKLYASIKAKIKRSIKGRRWGAYDSGRLVREYKSAGGGYTGKKGKTDLGRWYKEKWVDACAWPKRKSCGRKTKEKIAYCRPSKRIDSKTPKLVQQLTKAQIKSRCAKKKKSPMKRVTKFGATQEIVDKMRQQMYNQIMASSDVSSGIENTISKRCKRGFQDSFCQSIFTDLLLSIYYTIVKNSVLTDNRKQNISEMEKFIPNNFKPTLLKINKSQFSKIDEMLYSLQDHTYGTFKNARVASLIYEYIHVK
jgi:CRISPR/Cas system-associated protein endoribonuclease Cas2